MKNIKFKTRFLQLNNFFDKGLYQEGMRQIKTLGIVATVLSTVAAAVLPLYIFFIIVEGALLSFSYTVIPFSELIENFKECKDIIASNNLYFGYLTLILLVFVPIACFILFNFLTKRKSCDYFHSFPQKRGCIYTSYLLAILTWVFFIISGFTVCSLTICLGLGYFFDVSVFYILQYSLYTFVAAALGAVTICMACSMTGTLFTNVIISGILLFLPRIFITAISTFLVNTSEVFVSNHLTFWSEFDTNLIFSFITRIFTDLIAIFSGPAQMPSFTAFVYTLVLVIIYYSIGRHFFVKRNSESAGHPADSKLTRFIFRICTGMPYALVAIILVLSNIYFSEDGTVEPVIFFFVVVLQIVGIATIFIYEMISTKSFNVLLRVLPAIPVYIVIQAVIVLISCGIQTYELSFEPDPEDIDYVTIKSLNDEEYASLDGNDYFLTKLLNRKYYNGELITIVSDQLKNDIQSEVQEYEDYTDYYDVTVVINHGIRNKYRTINLTEAEYNSLLISVFKEESFTDDYMTIPEFNSDNIYLYDEGLYDYNERTNSYNYDRYEYIYNIMREELKTVDPVKFTALINGYNGYYSYCHFSIEGEARYNGQNTSLMLPITSLTPNTLMAYMNTINNSDLNSPTAIGQLEAMMLRDYFDDVGGVGYYSSNIYVFNEDFSDVEFYLDNKIYLNSDEAELQYIEYYLEALEQLRTSCTEEITDIDKEGYTLVEYQIDYGNYKGYGYVETEIIENLISYGMY